MNSAIGAPAIFAPFLIAESVSLIDGNGTNLNTNQVSLATNAPGTSAGLPSRQYDCSRIDRR